MAESFQHHTYVDIDIGQRVLLLIADTTITALPTAATDLSSMAELLGTVASGFAVAEVAGKAGGAVFKLKKLWDEINNVPETIADLMMQIECLDPAIWEVETQFVHSEFPPQLWNDVAARKSTQCCRIALRKLNDLVGDLAIQVSSTKRMNRKLARLKVVLKKDELRALEKRLETAVRMLQSAQNGYMM